MLRIRRSANGQVVFRLSGRMDREDIAELETLIGSEGNENAIVLDLRDVTLVGQDAITFLDRCEANGITLKNCARYIREWITRQRAGS
jgi:anti-anti-sigma regulatory factor